jgi:hypothetical protein
VIFRGSREIQNRAIYRLFLVDTNHPEEFRQLRITLDGWFSLWSPCMASNGSEFFNRQYTLRSPGGLPIQPFPNAKTPNTLSKDSVFWKEPSLRWSSSSQSGENEGKPEAEGFAC